MTDIVKRTPNRKNAIFKKDVNGDIHFYYICGKRKIEIPEDWFLNIRKQLKDDSNRNVWIKDKSKMFSYCKNKLTC